jgi:glycogen operon protein
VFRRRGWFQGKPFRRVRGGTALPDIAWLTPDGAEMTEDAWQSGESPSLQVFVSGTELPPDERGEPILDDTFLIIFHAHHEDGTFVLPDPRFGATWRRVLDTVRGFADDEGGERYAAGAQLSAVARSLWLLRREAP